MNNLKMKIAGFKSECLILCKDAKKGDEIRVLMNSLNAVSVFS